MPRLHERNPVLALFVVADIVLLGGQCCHAGTNNGCVDIDGAGVLAEVVRSVSESVDVCRNHLTCRARVALGLPPERVLVLAARHAGRAVLVLLARAAVVVRRSHLARRAGARWSLRTLLPHAVAGGRSPIPTDMQCTQLYEEFAASQVVDIATSQ